MAVNLLHKDLTEQIIGAAIAVYKELRPGLLESAYEACLAHELIERGLSLARQLPIPVNNKGIRVDCGYRADMIVEDIVLLELKGIEQFAPIQGTRLLSCLKLSRIRVGLLLNFHELRLLDGLKRRIL